MFDRGGLAFFDVKADGFAQFMEGDGELVFDGFDRDAKDLCHLFVFKAVFFYEFEDDLAFGWQLIDRLSEQGHHVGRDQ